MDLVVLLAVMALLAVIVWLVGAPLRAGAAAGVAERHDAQREDLEAAKEAKYREIRDAEMDRRTGKLSDQDWRELDRELRAEAVDILRRLDELP